MNIPEDRVEGIISEDGQTYTSDIFVSTLSPFQLTALMPERHLARKAFFHQLTQLEPISRIILNFQSDQFPSRPRIVLTDSPFHWMTWYRIGRDEKSFLSCIASGNDTLESLSDEQLEATAIQAIHNVFPKIRNSPSQHVEKSNLFRHSQASIAYSPGTMTFRPSHNTPLSNLFLAGHWTVSNGLCQVEGDVESANRCADMIKEQLQLQPNCR